MREYVLIFKHYFSSASKTSYLHMRLLLHQSLQWHCFCPLSYRHRNCHRSQERERERERSKALVSQMSMFCPVLLFNANIRFSLWFSSSLKIPSLSLLKLSLLSFCVCVCRVHKITINELTKAKS